MLNLVMPVEICICLKISDQMHTRGKIRPHPKTKNNIASHVYFWRNFIELIINPFMIFCKLFHASFVQWSRVVWTQVKSTLSTLYVASGAFALISIVEMFFRFWRFSKSFLIIAISFVWSDAIVTRYIFTGNRNYARCCDPGSRSWLISYAHEYCPLWIREWRADGRIPIQIYYFFIQCFTQYQNIILCR